MKVNLSEEEIDIIMGWAINLDYPTDEDIRLLDKLKELVEDEPYEELIF